MTDSETKLAQKASKRYWESDESVNGIAERLGISKGRLYDVLRPLPVEGSCPKCGGTPPVFHNRTARDHDQVSCLQCGWEGDLEKLGEAPPLEEQESVRSQVSLHRGSAREVPSLVGLGGVLVGLALGVVLTRMLDR